MPPFMKFNGTEENVIANVPSFFKEKKYGPGSRMRRALCLPAAWLQEGEKET